MRKHNLEQEEAANAEMVLREATAFLKSLEDLRTEMLTRDNMFKEAKQEGNKEKMVQYQTLANEISQKCLNYGRELCEKPIPHWVDSGLSKEKVEIAHHAYDVIRNKLCASLSVFDGDLLPNARALLNLAEGRL